MVSGVPLVLGRSSRTQDPQVYKAEALVQGLWAATATKAAESEAACVAQSEDVGFAGTCMLYFESATC